MGHSTEVIAAHEKSGRYFEVSGLRSFTLDAGDGAPVVCLHGVPASCFLYRKLVPALVGHGLRGIAFDLPGLGLAQRPVDFDYSWSGLGRFACAAVDALALDRFHLVVHDIGGPVGFELAAAMPQRIASLTILNTLIKVSHFNKPWVMRPFELPLLGELWLASLIKPFFRVLMAMQGIADRSGTPDAELDAWVDLLKRDDGGRAFLKIMRHFETTIEKEQRYLATVRDVPYPVQIIWGDRDPALRWERYGREAEQATGLNATARLPAKHFLPEDQAPAIARHIAALAGRA